MRKSSVIFLIFYGLVSVMRCAEVEPKESSFLVQENNAQEFGQLRDLLGMPVGDAKTAKATNGKKRTTKFMPKCPKRLLDVPKNSVEIVLKRCPSLRKKEYNKQEKKVAEIIMNAKKKAATTNYQQQKKALIMAVNHLAKLAGPLPSI